MNMQKILMLKQNDTIFALPIDKRMTLYLYYWFINCNKEIKKALNIELIFDSIDKTNAREILSKSANVRDNKDLVMMNKIVNIIYKTKSLHNHNKVNVKDYIKELKK